VNTKAQELDGMMRNYSGLMESALTQAEERAKQITTSLGHETAGQVQQTLGQIEKLREEAQAHTARAVTDLRGNFETVITQVGRQLEQIRGQFDNTSRGMREQAQKTAVDLDSLRQNMQARLDSMPEQAAQATTAIRKALNDQLREIEAMTPNLTQAASQAAAKAAIGAATQAAKEAARQAAAEAASLAASEAANQAATHAAKEAARQAAAEAASLAASEAANQAARQAAKEAARQAAAEAASLAASEAANQAATQAAEEAARQAAEEAASLAALEAANQAATQAVSQATTQTTAQVEAGSFAPASIAGSGPVGMPLARDRLSSAPLTLNPQPYQQQPAPQQPTPAPYAPRAEEPRPAADDDSAAPLTLTEPYQPQQPAPQQPAPASYAPRAEEPRPAAEDYGLPPMPRFDAHGRQVAGGHEATDLDQAAGGLPPQISGGQMSGGGRQAWAPAEPDPGGYASTSAGQLRIDELARSIDIRTATEVWYRMRAGERGVLGRHIYTYDGQATFDEISNRYDRDPEFRNTVDRYVADFERLLAEAEQSDPAGNMLQNYLTSETGRVYLLLAHASGRLR
jgi:hypothetical protein